MRLIDLDEFFRENCIDRMDGKSCEECKHHVLEVSCERLMEQPTIDIEEAVEYIKNAQEYLRDIGETWCANYLSDVVELLVGER